jgi:hypothetical protein
MWAEWDAKAGEVLDVAKLDARRERDRDHGLEHRARSRVH